MSELASLIVAVATLISAIASLVVSLRNSRKIEAVHQSTNGLSERNEAIARKLGVAEGTAAQKDRDDGAKL